MTQRRGDHGEDQVGGFRSLVHKYGEGGPGLVEIVQVHRPLDERT